MGKVPGIAFQTLAPQLPEKLPRMDVAAFVGFAAAGPLGVPVPVEDEVDFRQIFGPDLDLAWDSKAGAMQTACLGPAVRAFFANGGRRCWVVRVAGSAAQYNRFLIPGLLRADAAVAPAFRPADGLARSAGAWSDHYRFGATLNPAAVGRAVSLSLPETGKARLVLALTARDGLAPGDLLRIKWAGQLLLLAVESTGVETASSTGAGAQSRGLTWALGPAWRFATAAPASVTAGNVTVRIRLPDGTTEPPIAARWEYVPDDAPPGARTLSFPAGVAPPPPESLIIAGAAGSELLLPVLRTEPYYGTRRRVVCRAPLQPLRLDGCFMPGGSFPVAERLTFDLRATGEPGGMMTLRGLGFHPKHKRYFGFLPTDDQLFGRRPDAAPLADGGPAAEQIRADAADPRFPLAGGGWAGAVYLPVGMDELDRTEQHRLTGPLPVSSPAPVRNGLDSFSPDLFLDPKLSGYSATSLPAAIFHQRYVAEADPGDPGGTNRGRLGGIYSLWPVEEVTLVAVPDVLHPPWRKTQPERPQLLAAPDIRQAGPRPEHLSWTEVTLGARTVSYTLQEAADVEFTREPTAYRTGEASYDVPVPRDCPTVRYYRVRGECEGQAGPWSETVRRKLPSQSFNACVNRDLDVPTLTALASEPGWYSLSWTAVGAPLYTVEEALDPEFLTGRTIFHGRRRPVLVTEPGRRPVYYRVRAERPQEPGPWSRTVTLYDFTPEPVWTLDPPALPDPLSPGDTAWCQGLKRVHQALLRFCAARGDLMAVLALPVSYRDDAALEYTALLTAAFTAEVEEQCLSYGALYHPWPVVREEGKPARALPPDGAATGMISARTISRGAWVAPANVPLNGVLTLAPPLPDDARARFYDRQINLLLADPRGKLLLSADTLSLSSQLRAISVRRLMILLRRLVLREGMNLMFEPNNEPLRRAIQRQFEGLLSYLYERGAFAGSTPAESFQVDAGPGVNPRESIDLGRLVVELRVAPSRPLEFLTVRLVQDQGGTPAVEEG